MPKNLGGSIPQMVRNPEGAGIKRLYFSQAEHALIKDKTCAPGYGVLKAGTIMAVNTSAAGNKGMLVPYVPVFGSQVAGLNTDAAKGVAPLLQNGVSGSVVVSIADSYKFAVGDQIYYQNASGSGLVDCGVITAIDRTTNGSFATISCGAYTATNATTALKAYVYVIAGATPFSIAKFMLDKDVDTGVGEEAAGALAPVLISNAIVYSGSLVNCTAEALASLGCIVDGPHTIFK
jgi:hypothetical protein